MSVHNITPPGAILPPATTREPIPAKPSQPQPASVQREQLAQAVKELSRAVEPLGQSIQFSIDQQTGKTVVKIVDSSTNEVIRQTPGEEVLAFARTMDRLEGLLVDQQA